MKKEIKTRAEGFKVAGVTFEGRQKILQELSGTDWEKAKVELIPEPDNEYDSNAVKVVIEGKQVGYVPVPYNIRILKFLKENLIQKISVREIGRAEIDEKFTFYVRIGIIYKTK